MAVTDPLGRTVRYTYDGAGRIVRVQRPDGAETRATYNALGLPVRILDADGSEWFQDYAENGNPLSVTDPAGRTTCFTHDSAGRLTSVTDPAGNTTRIRTDKAGLPLAITDPLGGTTRCTRDAFGRPATLADALGTVSHWEWTPEGKPARRTAADGSEETWLYDGEGNCTHHTDANGSTERFEYTFFDLVSARTGVDGVRYEFTYNTELALTRVTNPQGRTWSYEYDPAGRLVRETDFDGRVQTYTHDAAGQLTSRTTPLGEVIHYERDTLGQIMRKEAAGCVTEYAYDLGGRLLRATNPDTVLEFLRDPTGQVLCQSVNGRTLTLTYDDLGRRTTRTTPTGVTSTWAHDEAGNRTELTANGHRIAFTHNAAGLETARAVGEVTLARTYDSLGRVTAQTVNGPANRLLQQRTYTYRPDGYPTRIDDHLGGTRSFDLDRLGRVTSVRAGDWQETYAYDAAGNQTSAFWPDSHPGAEARGTRTYEGTRITRAGSIRYEHDAAGRITLRQKTRLSRKPDTWRYTWDAEDRLTSVVTPDGTVWRYRYDALGRRTDKQRLAADGETVLEHVVFTWDGTTLCEQTTRTEDAPDPVTLTWDHDGLHPISQTERITAADAPQHEVDARFFAIITDLVGTPTALVDEQGEIGWRARTTLWGTTTWTTDSTAYTPLRFPGQYFDPETGLHYNYRRYYDPHNSRYLTTDPLGLAPCPNPHAYPHNPCIWTDFLGLSGCSDVTRGGDDGTYFISHNASGSGVLADLDDNGILTLMMHNNPAQGSPLRGKDMFDEVMGHFGDRVRGVQGTWIYGDNLGGFNEAVRGGSSLVSAAKGTWTGRQAARHGFTRARVDEAIPRLDGDFQRVIATFRK